MIAQKSKEVKAKIQYFGGFGAFLLPKFYK
jgi:hypothetical protein